MPAAAAAAAAAQAVAARGEQNGTKTLLLRSGGMLGSASGGTTKLATSLSGTVPAPSSGVTWSQLQNFLFPANLEHPESTGRLELFAQHGPVDQSSRLRGGRGGKHVHTDAEIRLMIKNETREALFAVIGKPRDTAEIKHILKDVPVGSSGQMDFADLQDAILANQQRRLKALVKHRGGVVKERGPVVPYQSAAADALMEVTRRKKVSHPEEQLARLKKLQSGCTLIAGLEEQNLTNSLTANVQLIRGLGSVSDRWDRYCALRRTGKSSYVEAKNVLRPSDYDFDDDGMKHRGQAIEHMRGMECPIFFKREATVAPTVYPQCSFIFKVRLSPQIVVLCFFCPPLPWGSRSRILVVYGVYVA
ncbi:unnamed protein product [Prorocentrum cordatum]|uniref:Protein NO VEIN C-terminal domain-containing protein n=1 Tax=Prorocentrum cordatum TaxID=2364126 RepID=A0ABN9T3X6_9DINO|nr:unnamed protein product [Polarella glacialis]